MDTTQPIRDAAPTVALPVPAPPAEALKAPPARRPHWGRLLMTLGVGTVGGLVANYLTLPLPWMIGSMVCVTALALGGVRVDMPRRWANLLIPVLGLWLGSSFTPELLAQMVQWYPSVLGLVGWMLASGSACYLYFRKVCGLDRVTAYFSATPGGLTDMSL